MLKKKQGYSMRRFILFAVLAGAIIAAGGLWYVYKAPYAAAARFPAASEAVVTRFTTLPKPARADYLALAGYVVEGFLTYATPTNARALSRAACRRQTTDRGARGFQPRCASHGRLAGEQQEHDAHAALGSHSRSRGRARRR